MFILQDTLVGMSLQSVLHVEPPTLNLKKIKVANI